MKTILCAVIALTAFTGVASAMDCQQEFRVRLSKMMSKTLPSNEMVDSTRFVLQGYDACMKGDMNAAKEFFERAAKFGG